MFSKILIANRGEIAVRIIRACKEMGIRAVAVYSEIDRDALHVRFADEAYLIGPAPARESYLRIDRILDVAKEANAEAIHPGYGFLAENDTFAQACESASIVFIGPSHQALKAMGDKTIARQMMIKVGVPVIPGTEATVDNPTRAREIAENIGYPIMIKAALGGGGKGMRIVHHADELTSALRGARSEAGSAFGDDRIFIERYVQEPRHIEFQILADAHGHVIHLGERECSIQRRHQKVIEESPSTALDENLRQKMGAAAVSAAQAARYTNAGTVEFLLDKKKKFYFLEMNTRLQVEHPVTELVTQLDLVKEQIRIAAGEQLHRTQEELTIRGSAIECRIYAEDPDNNFYPSTGTIQHLIKPSGPGIRDDGGMYEGCSVSLYYDPLISKLVVWGKDRTESIARMKRALREYMITGIKTTIPFCLKVMENERFVRGTFDTHFIEKELEHGPSGRDGDECEIAALAAALAAHRAQKSSMREKGAAQGEISSPWKMEGRRLGLRRGI
ncbi:MAG: acetyl-CoA carboxylase biotin carboxylase subunit [Gemmatimonadota bacterium]|nr:MAG: acetyl-CoA carboxylase biotin carboxylase subunit [Gemmatimonadota bacterium]